MVYKSSWVGGEKVISLKTFWPMQNHSIVFSTEVKAVTRFNVDRVRRLVQAGRLLDLLDVVASDVNVIERDARIDSARASPPGDLRRL